MYYRIIQKDILKSKSITLTTMMFIAAAMLGAFETVYASTDLDANGPTVLWGSINRQV